MKNTVFALLVSLVTSSSALAAIDHAECKRWINQKWTGTDDGVGYDPSVGEHFTVEHLSAKGSCKSEVGFPGLWFNFKFSINGKGTLKKECCHFTVEETDGDVF
jgi:hypothetical protein